MKRIKKHFRSIVMATVILGITLSCQKQDELVVPVKSIDAQLAEQGLTRTKLGKQLENPYSVENMQIALDSLRAVPDPSNPNGRTASEDIEIETTDLYVRFLPKDSVQYEAMIRDSTMVYSGQPLDYEVAVQGDVIVDATLADGQPNWQYTVVNADYKFSDTIQYQVLAELFIPENHPSYEEENGRTTGELSHELARLEAVSLYLTDNLPEEELEEMGAIDENGRRVCIRIVFFRVCWNEPDPWYPKGHIRVHNNFGAGRLEGVPYIKVHAWRWFTIKSAYTNASGYYRINHGFKRSVRYYATYKNGWASIKPSWYAFWPATNWGPWRKGDWNYDSYRGSRTYLWGAIMRGVYEYNNVYARMFNIGRTPTSLRIRACENNDCGLTTMLHSSNLPALLGGVPWVVAKWLLSDVRIGGKNDSYRDILATTYHELGHTAHWNLVGSNWVQSAVNMGAAHKLVREGWASGVNDQMYLQKFGIAYYQGCRELQDMINDGYPRVLVRDLIDNVNEFNPSNANCNVNDPVALQGFTMNEIFYSLRGIAAWKTNNAMKQWRDNLAGRRSWQKDRLNDYFAQYEK